MYCNQINRKNSVFENLYVQIVDALIIGGYTQEEAIELVTNLLQTLMTPDELVERVKRSKSFELMA